MRFESSYIGRTGVPPVKMYKYHRTSETLVLPDVALYKRLDK